MHDLCNSGGIVYVISTLTEGMAQQLVLSETTHNNSDASNTTSEIIDEAKETPQEQRLPVLLTSSTTSTAIVTSGMCVCFMLFAIFTFCFRQSCVYPFMSFKIHAM